MPEPTMKRAALDALARGWSVFPAHEKRPLVPWAPYQKRLPTKAEVRKWWAQHPDAQIAVATGVISGLIVLDLDGPEGRESVAGMSLPASIVAETGNGRHHYFRHPGLDDGRKFRNFARRLPGVDFRGDGGYVIIPPSVHSVTEDGEERRYAWASPPGEAGLVDPPAWLLELLEEPAWPKGDRRAVPRAEDGTPWHEALLALGVDEGARNDALARLAGYLLAKGLDEETVLYMLEGWNATKVRPPLDEREVETTVRSIARAERRKREGVMVSDPEDGGDEAQRRAKACEFASDQLGFSVERVIRYARDPALYEIQAEGHRLPLGGVEGLIEYTPFRRRIADGLGRMVKIARKDWPDVAELLLAATETVEIDEATDRGLFVSRLSQYLEDHAPAGGEGAADPDYWQAAAWEGQPIVRGGETMISLVNFRKWIAGVTDEKIGAKDLAYQARAFGLAPSTVSVHLRGRQTTRSYWSVPAGMLREIGIFEVPA